MGGGSGGGGESEKSIREELFEYIYLSSVKS